MWRNRRTKISFQELIENLCFEVYYVVGKNSKALRGGVVFSQVSAGVPCCLSHHIIVVGGRGNVLRRHSRYLSTAVVFDVHLLLTPRLVLQEPKEQLETNYSEFRKTNYFTCVELQLSEYLDCFQLFLVLSAGLTSACWLHDTPHTPPTRTHACVHSYRFRGQIALWASACRCTSCMKG